MSVQLFNDESTALSCVAEQLRRPIMLLPVYLVYLAALSRLRFGCRQEKPKICRVSRDGFGKSAKSQGNDEKRPDPRNDVQFFRETI